LSLGITDPIGDLRVDADEKPRSNSEGDLAVWVMNKVDRWREYRDVAFKERWGEYYRLWRGRWSQADRNRNSERSQLIAPALSQAIEMTVSEMEEATFGRQQWFDIRDDINQDQQSRDIMLRQRDMLTEDMERDNVTDAICMSFLNGALYGNGIAKIIVSEDIKRSPGDVNPVTQVRSINERTEVTVKLDPLPADEFVPDPSATCVDEMLGCAHELNKPLSWVNKMQARGFYRTPDLIAADGLDSEAVAEREDLEGILTRNDTVFITEYHGLIPVSLLPTPKDETRTPLDDILDATPAVVTEGEEMVEAIVTIGNKTDLLRAVRNPFWMQDRSIVSYQHEKVPGRFWGRSVAEKGFNPQKALDAELRARMDALALISNPMMSADITRLPRGFDMRIRPGKLWLTNGNPSEVIKPIAFQGLDPSTFSQSGEMERMVQVGTGAMDTATPIKMNERNSTATGTSVQMQSFVKRSKRAMRNVENNFLRPLIQKILWRYMQFAPDKYTTDIDFRISGTLGIVARELEQQQLTQLMAQHEQGSPVQLILTKAIVDNSASPFKAEIVKAIDQQLAGPSPEEQALQQFQQQIAQQTAIAEAQQIQLENSKLQTEAMLNIARVQELASNGEIEGVKLQMEIARVQKEFAELTQLARQNDAALINAQANLRKALSGGTQNANQSEPSQS